MLLFSKDALNWSSDSKDIYIFFVIIKESWIQHKNIIKNWAPIVIEPQINLLAYNSALPS